MSIYKRLDSLDTEDDNFYQFRIACVTWTPTWIMAAWQLNTLNAQFPD